MVDGLRSVDASYINRAYVPEEQKKEEQKTATNSIIAQKKEEENTEKLPQGYRIERTLDDKDNYKARVAEVQKQIEKQGTIFEGGSYTAYTNKDEYKAAKKERKVAEKNREAEVEKLKQQYINEGYDKKAAKKKAEAEVPQVAKVKHQSAKKLAENYVDNEKYKQHSETTTVYMDKEAYEKAEENAEKERKNLQKQYMDSGMSKKEAKEKAENTVGLNTYVKSKNVRRFVLDNKEAFSDEKGNFSSDKFKKLGGIVSNINTGKNEETNYYTSLKEADKAAAKYNANKEEGDFAAKRSTFTKMAKYSNMGYEHDNTNLYRGLFIGGCTAVGAAACAALSTTATAGSATSSAAGATAGSAAGAGVGTAGAEAGAVAGAASGATASANVTGAGAAVGGSVGLLGAGFLKDKGNTEGIVIKLNKEKPTTQPPTENPVTPPTENPVTPPTKNLVTPQPCPDEPSNYCDYVIKKRGEGWSNVIAATVQLNGKTLDGKLLKAYIHATKLKHGITDFTKNTAPEVYREGKDISKCTIRLYSDFSDLTSNEELVKKYPELALLKNLEFDIPNCDKKVKSYAGGTPKVGATKYTGTPTDPVCYDCNGNIKK